MRGEAGTLQNAREQAYAAGSEEGPSREVTLRTMKERWSPPSPPVFFFTNELTKKKKKKNWFSLWVFRLLRRDLADHLIPLEGLRVEEAIRALRHELGVLRWRARLARRRLQVVLLDEGLRFSEDLPGLLRVLVE
ncbi:unnamed protein product [Spirodela intermedia]|uniref:Uncharacterized protein n=1 Tax=Spirodela intermedia TaxID=51605 RepID=A0A7I8INB9_SPIIN|nr:unnamed protein product [Spirodela intermedia]CAA6659308.1 unnamed protein product [Spirodela intermedia]